MWRIPYVSRSAARSSAVVALWVIDRCLTIAGFDEFHKDSSLNKSIHIGRFFVCFHALLECFKILYYFILYNFNGKSELLG